MASLVSSVEGRPAAALVPVAGNAKVAGLRPGSAHERRCGAREEHEQQDGRTERSGAAPNG